MPKKQMPKPVNLNDCILLHQMGYRVEINDGKVKAVVKEDKKKRLDSRTNTNSIVSLMQWSVKEGQKGAINMTCYDCIYCMHPIYDRETGPDYYEWCYKTGRHFDNIENPQPCKDYRAHQSIYRPKNPQEDIENMLSVEYDSNYKRGR